MAELLTGVTLHLRGENGAEWREDVPPRGHPRLGVFTELIDTGKVVVLCDDSGIPEPADDDEEWPDEVPEGTMDDIVAWVRQAPEGAHGADGWPERAQAALDAEAVKGDRARSTLIATLTEALER